MDLGREYFFYIDPVITCPWKKCYVTTARMHVKKEKKNDFAKVSNECKLMISMNVINLLFKSSHQNDHHA